ncbi:MAG: TIGR00282 family metallophosphoesterase [Treponema sp.]|jgi:metallophosphoesterase (TIGR00282 family)|nr:TIGR00282 family metallophosphoesterase [Treponema sp.]
MNNETVNIVRVAMIGDIVGSHGLETLTVKLPVLIKEHNLNFVTVNGENAAEGFGITEREYKLIIQAGVDVITSGNHVWEKREFWSFLENEKNILRPANYPPSVPGAGFARIEKGGVNWIVINLQGREFINAIDCPFMRFDSIVNEQKDVAKPQIIIVDFHAESSREKEAFAYHADGRASLIACTHTHVQTADERILPKGSAYITDIGMTGITDSVIGMDIKICQERFRKQVQYQMKPAVSIEQGQLQGIIAEIDADTGTAVSVKRIA